MGSDYDRRQTESLEELRKNSEKESKKTVWILIAAAATLAVSLIGLFK